jgi:hypothetical protein
MRRDHHLAHMTLILMMVMLIMEVDTDLGETDLGEIDLGEIENLDKIEDIGDIPNK